MIIDVSDALSDGQIVEWLGRITVRFPSKPLSAREFDFVAPVP